MPRALILLFAPLLLAVYASMARAQDVTTRDLLRIPVKDVPPVGKRALVVGIGNYARATPLRFTVNDAKRFAAFLVQSWGFSEENVTLMTDDSTNPNLVPTFPNLSDQLDLMVRGTRSDTEIVFFFSGHGVRQKDQDYLVPLDGNPDKIERTCVSATDFRNGLEGKKPRRAVLFVDACRNVIEGKSTVTRNLFSRDPTPPGQPQLAALYSCEAGETSREGKGGDFQNGVFTRFLLDGLGGDKRAANEDGTVTFESLSRYVRARVYNYVQQEYASAQTPFGLASFGAMVLTRAFVPETKPQAAAPDPKSQARSLVEQAFQLLINRRLDDAAERARQALTIDTDNPNARYILGSVLLAKGQAEEAIRELSLAKKLNPDLPGIDEKLQEADRKKTSVAMPAQQSAAEVAKDAERRLLAGEAKLAEIQANVVLYVRKEATPADRALAFSVLGRLFEAQQKNDEALRAFQEAKQLQPDLRAALEGLERLARLAAKVDILAKTNEALRLALEGKLLDAELRAREVLAQEPDQPKAHFVLGRVYASQTRYDDAIRSFQTALDRDPTFSDARTALKEVEQRKSERVVLTLANRAGALLEQNLPDEAEAAARAVLARGTPLAPANGLAHFVLGRVAEERKRNEEALREYQEALRLEPGRDPARQGLDRVLRAIGDADLSRLVQDALRLLEQNQLTEAEAKAREVIARAPGNATARLVLGRVLARSNRDDDAVQELQEARRLDESLRDVEQALSEVRGRKNTAAARRLVDEAYVHASQDEWLDAAAKAREAAALDDANPNAHALLAYTSYWMKEDAPAEREVARALALDANSALAYVARGIRPYLEATRRENPALLDAAVTEYRKALSLKADDFLAINDLGAVYFEQRKFDQALPLFQEAVRLRPGHAVAQYNLASVFMAKSDWAQAERCFRAAVTLRPQVGRYHAGLAGALWMQKRQPEAAEAARQGIRLGWTEDWVYPRLEKAKHRIRPAAPGRR